MRNVRSTRKHNYSYVLQGHYGGRAGWEDLTAEECHEEINARLRDYRDNDVEAKLFRVVSHREPHNR